MCTNNIIFLQLPYIIPALGDPKICAEGRKDLFEWVARHVAKNGDQPVLLQLTKPISMALQVLILMSCCHILSLSLNIRELVSLIFLDCTGQVSGDAKSS